MEPNQNIQQPEVVDETTQALGNMLGITDPQAQGTTADNPTPMQPTNEPQTTTTEPTTEPNRENPTRQLRAQYDAQKKQLEERTALLQRIAQSRGLSSVEDLVAKLQEDEDKAKANSRNIPIEIQQQLRVQEEKIKELEMQNLRSNYQSREAQLRAQFNLSEQQMYDFARKAEGAGFNVFTPNLDLNVLYKAMNYDSLEQDLRNQIRQEVLAELQGNNTNTIRQGTSTTPSTSSDLSVEEFYSKLFK